MNTLPLPPLRYRTLVGPTEDSFFDNPSGSLVFPDLPAEAYDSVFDWGSGCGRLARQLIQQNPRPRRYTGVDLHRGMVDWCRKNLAPHAPGFTFAHDDVFSLSFNPGGSRTPHAFPAADGSVTLFIAWSVFTHVNEEQTRFYLRELARVLAPRGIAVTTWFLFDKGDFPMMQEFQNALFINDVDPTNAVIFDRSWLRNTLREVGLVSWHIDAPMVRGFQWRILLSPAASGAAEVEYPEDAAPRGIMRPPLMPAGAAD